MFETVIFLFVIQIVNMSQNSRIIIFVFFTHHSFFRKLTLMNKIKNYRKICSIPLYMKNKIYMDIFIYLLLTFQCEIEIHWRIIIFHVSFQRPFHDRRCLRRTRATGAEIHRRILNTHISFQPHNVLLC